MKRLGKSPIIDFDYLILAGGRLPLPKDIKPFLKFSDQIVTVDRGAELALKLKLRPVLHVGDGDSFSFSKLKKLGAQATLQLPQKKSISDLEYAVNHLEMQKTKLVMGAHNDFEGRPDHAFINFMLLSERRNIVFADKGSWITRINPKEEFKFSVPKNTVFTLVPMNSENKVTISGSSYDVRNKAFNCISQGLSNATSTKTVSIMSSGAALLFVSSSLTKTKLI